MAKVRVTQIRSVIDQTKRQKATMHALGLTKINQIREHELNAQIKGMLKKVEHLVQVEEI
ncbi:MAG: 50S ribosomal protein L30 [Saprospiraceae bacterium]|nr:50S ribosomal protein L30 [Saprospiraceae bacterium]